MGGCSLVSLLLTWPPWTAQLGHDGVGGPGVGPWSTGAGLGQYEAGLGLASWDVVVELLDEGVQLVVEPCELALAAL